MKFKYIPKDKAEKISEICNTSSCVEELDIKLSLLGACQLLELDEIKKIAQIGDRILVKYENREIPCIIVAKKENGDLVCNSEDCLERRRFDPSTNKWKISELRAYLNGPEFAKKFDPEFLELVKTEDVHTEDYVTHDKFWILSHEEVNCPEDRASWFKPNKGAVRFPYFTDNASRIKRIWE